MHKIILKSLSLSNFKGVRQAEINFAEQGTVISGENGTGKTTVFDAFLWLLFGKDSTGRSDSNFSIKTYDAEGCVIPKLEHSVCGVLDVDGQAIKLLRIYSENWVKPRGKTEEYLKDHKTEFYINDVKLGAKAEYDAEINAIIPEDVFKMITNIHYFPSLKPEEQRATLLDMATVTDEEIAAIKPEYVELLAQLSGRTLAQYAKEVAAKKKACKDALAVIPSQIETANKLKPEAENWDALNEELAEKKRKLSDIDEQIADRSKVNEQKFERKLKLQKQIGEKRLALNSAENAIRMSANAGRNKATMDLQNLEFKLSGTAKSIEMKESSAKRLNDEIGKLDAEMSALRGEYRTVFAEQLTYPEGAFECPTCHRPLEVEDIEEKQRNMQASFNQNKADRLKAIQEKGTRKKAAKEDVQKQIDLCLSECQNLRNDAAAIQSQIDTLRSSMPKVPDVEAMITADQNCIDLKNEIAELENQLKIEAKSVDLSDLKEGKTVLNDAIAEITTRLGKKAQIERINKEIAELEDRQKANSQTLADLEKWEFAAMSFQKDKDARLLERINGLFKVVSFSFVSKQLNGGEKLTCVCTVNGTPYPDVNAAGKVNAGLDIINAICKTKGISAPIFVDNRESVNEIIPTISQVINLCVSKDKCLTVK